MEVAVVRPYQRPRHLELLCGGFRGGGGVALVAHDEEACNWSNWIGLEKASGAIEGYSSQDIHSNASSGGINFLE